MSREAVPDKLLGGQRVCRGAVCKSIPSGSGVANTDLTVRPSSADLAVCSGSAVQASVCRSDADRGPLAARVNICPNAVLDAALGRNVAEAIESALKSKASPALCFGHSLRRAQQEPTEGGDTRPPAGGSTDGKSGVKSAVAEAGSQHARCREVAMIPDSAQRARHNRNFFDRLLNFSVVKVDLTHDQYLHDQIFTLVTACLQNLRQPWPQQYDDSIYKQITVLRFCADCLCRPTMFRDTFGSNPWDRGKVNGVRVATVLNSKWPETTTYDWSLWEEHTDASSWSNHDLFKLLADVVGYRLDACTDTPVLLCLDSPCTMHSLKEAFYCQLLDRQPLSGDSSLFAHEPVKKGGHLYLLAAVSFNAVHIMKRPPVYSWPKLVSFAAMFLLEWNEMPQLVEQDTSTSTKQPACETWMASAYGSNDDKSASACFETVHPGFMSLKARRKSAARMQLPPKARCEHRGEYH